MKIKINEYNKKIIKIIKGGFSIVCTKRTQACFSKY